MTLTARQKRDTAPMPVESPSCYRVTRDLRRPVAEGSVVIAVPRTRSHDLTQPLSVICSCAHGGES